MFTFASSETSFVFCFATKIDVHTRFADSFLLILYFEMGRRNRLLNERYSKRFGSRKVPFSRSKVKCFSANTSINSIPNNEFGVENRQLETTAADLVCLHFETF